MAEPSEQATKRVFEAAGFRCCSLKDFALWRRGALAIRATGANFYRPEHDAGSALRFCLDCHPLVQREMAAQDRCVRVDMGNPLARERMRRWRERQKALVTGH